MKLTRRQLLNGMAAVTVSTGLSGLLYGRTFGDIKMKPYGQIIAAVDSESTEKLLTNALDGLVSKINFLDCKNILSSIPNIRNSINACKNQWIIGVMGNNTYPVFETLVRDKGASIICHGRHVINAKEERHVFTSTAKSCGIAKNFIADSGKGSRRINIREFSPGMTNYKKSGLYSSQNSWLDTTVQLYLACISKVSVKNPVATHILQERENKKPGHYETFIMHIG